MRVNVYAEEITNRVEIVEKNGFTGVRFYTYLPVTDPDGNHHIGPFKHGPNDDDSSAVTFWGKANLERVLKKALALLEEHHLASWKHNQKK